MAVFSLSLTERVLNFMRNPKLAHILVSIAEFVAIIRTAVCKVQIKGIA